ncbi:MAG: drug/metabolite transporter (DMT)-like permease [Paracoccaceae bacterium]|jgi:drug/metabolite transporter (DMT)-like permease
MLGFCTLAPMGDAIAKVLGGTIPVIELLLVRFAAQVVFLLPIIWLKTTSLKMNKRVLRLTFLRTVFHIIGIGAMFTSLKFLPLADAIAIAFVMPFIVLLLGKTLMNEQVGRRRLLACIAGFVGTLLVIQPSFASVGAPALLPLLVAVFFALFMLVTRQMAKDVDPVAMQVVSGFMATPILLGFILIGGMQNIEQLQMVQPNLGESFLMLSIGAIGTLAHLLMTWSLRFAPSATVAPMQYLEIPIATAIGWLVFHDLPNGLAAVGISITVAAGLYIIYREHQSAQPPAAPAV